MCIFGRGASDDQLLSKKVLELIPSHSHEDCSQSHSLVTDDPNKCYYISTKTFRINAIRSDIIDERVGLSCQSSNTKFSLNDENRIQSTPFIVPHSGLGGWGTIRWRGQ